MGNAGVSLTANSCDFIICDACYSLHSHMPRSCLRFPRHDSSLLVQFCLIEHRSAGSLDQAHRLQVHTTRTHDILYNLSHGTINATLLSTESANNAGVTAPHPRSFSRLTLLNIPQNLSKLAPVGRPFFRCLQLLRMLAETRAREMPETRRHGRWTQKARCVVGVAHLKGRIASSGVL